jgi:hypothetical protein
VAPAPSETPKTATPTSANSSRPRRIVPPDCRLAPLSRDGDPVGA